ncbi:TetR family transcriptional regulator [Bordetella genomosp. 8]|uniref:TetR family transcriptional regulator n=1 Tax=Bordetella genomosp. 8 TaxID=1416806 RepID=A0A1W6YQA0_9BORD|nr:TetR/AcrR family transcriptional regulator [Bordetella genomosp. 8]ARP83198.1 TetR family transcriptional regulator [Bordetella genomosp. 8]
MGRPRQFDEAQTLDLALRYFWQHGYEATSVRDLADAMALTGASVYNAYGDKLALYRRALERYIDTSIADRINRLQSRKPLQAIEGFYAEMIDRSLDDPDTKGCMLVNAALEMAPRDPDLRALIADVLRRIETFFRRSVQAGQRDGTITRSQSAADLARMLLGVQLGMRVLARARPEPALLRGMVRAALASLQPGVEEP